MGEKRAMIIKQETIKTIKLPKKLKSPKSAFTRKQAEKVFNGMEGWEEIWDKIHGDSNGKE